MKTLQHNIINSYGNQGKDWLAALPNAMTTYAKRYALRDLTAVANLSFIEVMA